MFLDASAAGPTGWRWRVSQAGGYVLSAHSCRSQACYNRWTGECFLETKLVKPWGALTSALLGWAATFGTATAGMCTVSHQNRTSCKWVHGSLGLSADARITLDSDKGPTIFIRQPDGGFDMPKVIAKALTAVQSSHLSDRLHGSFRVCHVPKPNGVADWQGDFGCISAGNGLARENDHLQRRAALRAER